MIMTSSAKQGQVGRAYAGELMLVDPRWTPHQELVPEVDVYHAPSGRQRGASEFPNGPSRRGPANRNPNKPPSRDLQEAQGGVQPRPPGVETKGRWGGLTPPPGQHDGDAPPLL